MQEMIAKILEKELVPALGCTEPMAFGLCAATARKYASGEIQSITIEASTSMVKGVQYVKIPRSGGLRGGKLAASIGAYGGNSDLGMEVFHSVTPEDVARAHALVESGRVSLARVNSPHRLFLKISMVASKGSSVVITQIRHNNIAYIEHNGEIVKDTRDAAPSQTTKPAAGTDVELDYNVLNVENIFNFCKNAPMEQFAIVEKAIAMNQAISEDGMNNAYGLEVARTLHSKLDQGVISDDLAMYSVIWGTAGVDARMGGSPFPAMTNTGSGNQGITSTAPVVAAGKYLKKSYEDIVRATALSNLLTIFVKTHCGKESSRMASVCCAAVAAGGASSGIAYLRGADAACVSRIMQTVLGNVAGLFCDGAKANCATKVAMALHSAIQAMLLSESGFGSDEFNGIVGATVENTIENFYRIQREGMSNIMEVLYSIEVDKNHVC